MLLLLGMLVLLLLSNGQAPGLVGVAM